ncbi:MAG: dipeptidase [Gemmatimonadetes bacterium]|nr:membrane dipeptidase [Gemmatimonadota bacterium]MYA42108.1 dipeptidase [Gemmatimonadota bacterium]MYJ09586.1 dipeptidase [Gemmatimonadota bacterium]
MSKDRKPSRLSAAPSRRAVLKAAAGAAGLTLATPFINRGRAVVQAHGHGRTATPQEYSIRCIDLVTGSLVIDMLSPLVISRSIQQRWGPDLSGMTAQEEQDFRDSEIDVFHIAVGVGGRDFEDQYENTLLFVAGYNAIIASRPDLFVRIDSAEDLASVHGSGRAGILIGLQTSSHFHTLDDVNQFYWLGQRVSQLTYNSRNMIGNGATERVDGGISDFGVAIVGRMNEIGMAVDVSHSGDRTTLDACEVSSRPVLFTHSNSRVLSGGHPRTKTDEAIRAMGATGGVMGITGVRMFVKDREPTTIEDYIDHFDHVRDLIGVEHLGVGSDVDLHGYDDMPTDEYEALKSAYKDSYAFRDKIDIEGVDHPKRMFDLTEALIRRGYTDDHIRGILGGNFQRVLGEIWEV